MFKSLAKCAWLLSLFFALTNSQGTLDPVREENFELSTSLPNSCDDIILDSRFDGDCCAMNRTSNGACILNIINGRCIISGGFWNLDWTSTFKSGGAKCPPSDFPDFAPASVAVEDDPEEVPEDSAGNIWASSMATGVALLGSAMVAFL